MQIAEGAFLSRRQAEIAQMLVSGKSAREIALALTLSTRTVETHVGAIYNKYGVNSRAELLLAVLAAGPANAVTPLTQRTRTNLPLRRERLVGRDEDIENITRLVEANRLVTLTGAGGIGKTQAALAVGEALLGDFLDGVWIAELARLAHGSAVAETVARALGVQPAKGLPLIDAIVASVKRKMPLLIIDNCEHMIVEVAALADNLMRSCPRLHILATSREAVRIAGEQTYRLPSLAVPAREDIAKLRATRGTEFSAVELFTQRARGVDYNFALDDETAPIVGEICRKVDGIPLAIQLAAARVNVLSLGALAKKIDSHLSVLAGGDRLATPRHQTMYALIDWSYQLLSPAEQWLFERMSVFAGGCALEQAAAICGDEIEDQTAILDLLSALVDKSMLVVNLESSEPRYSLLQSFGQYASEKLESRNESTAVRHRHAAAYAFFAERLEEEYHLEPNAAWYARAEREFENFVSALNWSLEERRDVFLAQRLAAALRPVWISTGAGGRWLQIACELTDERTPPLLAARLVHATASAQFDAGEFNSALATCRRLIATYENLGEPLRAAYAKSLSAYSLLFLGRAEEAEPLIMQALEVAHAHKRGMLVAFLLRAGANLSSLRGELHSSRRQLAEALATYERLGADRAATTMLASLAELEFRVGNAEHAFDLARKCLELQRDGQRWRHLILTLANIAAYSVALNRWEDARAYSREALRLAQEAQHATAEISALQHLAAAAVLSRSDQGSWSAPNPAAGPPAPFASSSPALAGAAQLLGYVDARTNAFRVVREYTEQHEYDRVLASLQAGVSAGELSQLLAQGALLTPEQAIEIALSI